MQSDWRVFTPRPGFYDEVGLKYREAMSTENAVVLVAEDEGEIVGMAYGEVRIPSRFSDERALELSGVGVRTGYRGRGVGRALAQEAAGVAGKTLAPSQGAMAFGEGLGFPPRVVQMPQGTKALVQRLSED